MSAPESVTRPEATRGPLRLADAARERYGALSLAGAVVLVLAIAVLGATTTNFFTVANGKAVLASASIVGIAALGATAIMVAGGMVSLATAALASLSAMVFLATLDLGLVPAVALSGAFGVLCYAGLGWLVGAWAVNPIILTIAAASIMEGGVLALNDGGLVTPAGGGFEHLNARLLGLPVSVFALVVLAVLLHVLLAHTPAGRRIHMVGENRQAARAAGFRVGRTVAFAFALAGALTAVAGMFLGAVNTNASLELGGTLNFDAIAAVLVGGAAIGGGQGSALRTLAGAIVIAAISDVLLLRGYDTGTQICVKGLLVLLVVLAVHLRATRGATR
jgi:simple sugar transport system permease protein/ribose transport system permease protein